MGKCYPPEILHTDKLHSQNSECQSDELNLPFSSSVCVTSQRIRTECHRKSKFGTLFPYFLPRIYAVTPDTSISNNTNMKKNFKPKSARSYDASDHAAVNGLVRPADESMLAQDIGSVRQRDRPIVKT